MNLIKILQAIWIFTAIFAFGLGIYNYTEIQKIDSPVYVPFIIFIFCVILFFNLKRQAAISNNIKEQKDNK
jgi:hypothetical protein